MDKKESYYELHKEYYINAAFHWIIRNLRAKEITIEEILKKSFEEGSNNVFQGMIDILTANNEEKCNALIKSCDRNGWEIPKLPLTEDRITEILGNNKE